MRASAPFPSSPGSCPRYAGTPPLPGRRSCVMNCGSGRAGAGVTPLRRGAGAEIVRSRLRSDGSRSRNAATARAVSAARGGATPSRGIARAVGFPLRVLDGGIRCRPGDVADALGERTVVRRNQPFAFGGSPAGLIDILRHVAGPLARIVEGAPCSTPHLFTRFRPGLLLETRLRQHGAEGGADREADGAREERLALDGGDETAAAITHAVSAATDRVTPAPGDTLPSLPRVIRKIPDAAAGLLAPVRAPRAR